MSFCRVTSVFGLLLATAAPVAVGQSTGGAGSPDIATAYRAAADSLIRAATADSWA